MGSNYYKHYISIQEANVRFCLGIASGSYGLPHKTRMLQFNPTIIRISEQYFQFGMHKVHGVFRAEISSEIASHRGIRLPLKKSCL